MPGQVFPGRAVRNVSRPSRRGLLGPRGSGTPFLSMEAKGGNGWQLLSGIEEVETRATDAKPLARRYDHVVPALSGDFTPVRVKWVWPEGCMVSWKWFP